MMWILTMLQSAYTVKMAKYKKKFRINIKIRNLLSIFFRPVLLPVCGTKLQKKQLDLCFMTNLELIAFPLCWFSQFYIIFWPVGPMECLFQVDYLSLQFWLEPRGDDCLGCVYFLFCLTGIGATSGNTLWLGHLHNWQGQSGWHTPWQPLFWR